MLGSGKSSGMVNEASNLKANQNLTNTIEQMNTTAYQQQRDVDDVIPTHRRVTKEEEAERKRLAANAGLAVYDPTAEKKQEQVERGNAPNAEDRDEDSDDELMELRRQRLARMKQQYDQEVAWRGRQHGQYREIGQDDFFNVVVREKGGSEQVCVHFFHKDFERCKVMDRRLSELAQQLLSVRFVKIDAEKAPFLVDRLKVIMLPCCLLFKNDVCVDRILGFDGVQDEEGMLDADMLHERIVMTMANYGNTGGDIDSAVVREAS